MPGSLPGGMLAAGIDTHINAIFANVCYRCKIEFAAYISTLANMGQLIQFFVQ